MIARKIAKQRAREEVEPSAVKQPHYCCLCSTELAGSSSSAPWCAVCLHAVEADIRAAPAAVALQMFRLSKIIASYRRWALAAPTHMSKTSLEQLNKEAGILLLESNPVSLTPAAADLRAYQDNLISKFRVWMQEAAKESGNTTSLGVLTALLNEFTPERIRFDLSEGCEYPIGTIAISAEILGKKLGVSSLLIGGEQEVVIELESLFAMLSDTYDGCLSFTLTGVYNDID